MGFKVTLIVLCLIISYLCLIEGANQNKHVQHATHKERKVTKHGKDHKETRIPKEDRIHPIILTRAIHRPAKDRQVDTGNEVEGSGGFNFNFNNIPGGAGIQMIFDGLKNVFMVVNRVLNFGFIWDGVSGIIALFNIETGATFAIDAVRRLGGFVGYMLTDVRNFINAITSGTTMIVTSALDLLRSTVRFVNNNAANLAVNAINLANAISGVAKENLNDVLGPVYKVVYPAFKQLFDAVGKLTNSIGNGIMSILEPIFGTIRFVTSPLVDIFSAVLRTAGGIFDIELFRAISQGLNGVLQNVVGGVVGGVRGITGGFFGAISGAINVVGTVFHNYGDAIASVFGRGDQENNESNETQGYTNIKTTTIVDEEPINFAYANNSNEYFQHFIREGLKNADLVIIYKSDKNFIAFFDRIKKSVFILSGNTGRIGIFDIENGSGIFFKPNSTTGYAIQPPAFLRADFIGPNAKNVSDALTKLSRSIDELNIDMDKTVDMVTFDIIEVLRTLTLKNMLSSILTGEALMVVSRLLRNLLYNLADGLLPMIRPSLGVANTLLPFLLNLPQNFINGIINLIGSVIKRFLGLFTPEFLAEMAKTVVISALKGVTTPMLASILTPIGTISTSLNLGLTVAQKAVDLLNLP